MSDHGLTIFSPFKIALVFGFTLLAWSDLVHGDQTALMAEILIIALYLNDLYLKRHQIMRARYLTWSEFMQQVRTDLHNFKPMAWVKNFFDTSNTLAKKRFTVNMFFAGILLSPLIMWMLNLTETEQSWVLMTAFVVWSIWFIVTNLKVFWRTRALSRLFMTNLGVYFLLCSLLLML